MMMGTDDNILVAAGVSVDKTVYNDRVSVCVPVCASV
jgi:hypothetical protein